MEASVGVCNFGEMEGNGVLDQWKQVCVGVCVSKFWKIEGNNALDR